MKVAKSKIKVLEVRVERVIDESPDTSWLGEFTDKASEWAIIRRTGEFVHKVSQRIDLIDRLDEAIEENEEATSQTTDHEGKEALLQRWGQLLRRRQWVKDSGDTELPSHSREYRFLLPCAGGEKQGTPEYKKYAIRDAKRLEGLASEDWCFVGIIAKAVVEIQDGEGIRQTLRSGGLWGIESDSRKEHLEEVAKEELTQLKEELIGFGVGPRAAAYAIKQWDGEFVDK
jgi:hypothetical protein